VKATMPFPGFKLTDAYRFAAAHGLKTEARAIRSKSIHSAFGRNRRHVPRKGAFVDLFESKGVMDGFVQQHWPTRHTPAGEKRRQSYLDGLAMQNRFTESDRWTTLWDRQNRRVLLIAGRRPSDKQQTFIKHDSTVSVAGTYDIWRTDGEIVFVQIALDENDKPLGFPHDLLSKDLLGSPSSR
jgi:hypothetical protein